MDSAKQRCYVAYDVSKATLMVAAPKGMPQGSLDNTQGAVDKQLQALIEHANRVNETLWLVCEATGGYQRTLEACAAKAGVPISVVPPAWIFHAKRSWGKLAKTDPLDAAWLQRRGQTLTVAAAKQALACAEAALKEQIAALDAEIASGLKERAKADVRLGAIRPLEGVGPGLLAVLHAYLPELGKVGRKQIASPGVRQSGAQADRQSCRGRPTSQGQRQTAREAIRLRRQKSRPHSALCGLHLLPSQKLPPSCALRRVACPKQITPHRHHRDGPCAHHPNQRCCQTGTRGNKRHRHSLNTKALPPPQRLSTPDGPLVFSLLPPKTLKKPSFCPP